MNRGFLILVGALFGLRVEALPVRPPQGSSVVLSTSGEILGQAHSAHQAQESRLEIVESDECTYQQTVPDKLRLSGECKYLAGIYRYRFTEALEPVHREMVVGFSVSRPSAASHVLLVSRPFQLPVSVPTAR